MFSFCEIRLILAHIQKYPKSMPVCPETLFFQDQFCLTDALTPFCVVLSIFFFISLPVHPIFSPLHRWAPLLAASLAAPPLLLSHPFFASPPTPLPLWQMGFNKSWQSDEIKGEHPMVGYSSSPSVALTYLKQGLNSVVCSCLSSPGFYSVINIIITAWHCIVARGRIKNYMLKKRLQLQLAPVEADHPVANQGILEPRLTPR